MRKNLAIDYVQGRGIGDLNGSDPKNTIHKKIYITAESKNLVIRLILFSCQLLLYFRTYLSRTVG
jgi:hypothetical protein